MSYGREKNYEGHFEPQSLDGVSRSDFGSALDDEFGGIIGDIEDDISSVGNTLVGLVPDALKDKFSQFADTAVGHVVLFAASGGVYAALVPSLGPQIAAISFAMPGMAKGDNFMKAWTEGFAERITILIKYFISTGVPQSQAADMATDAAQSDMQKAQSYVDQIGGVAKLGGIDFQTLAAKAGIREDMAAEYLANAVGNLSLPSEYNFDPATGKVIGKAIPNTKDKLKKIQASIDPMSATSIQGRGIAASNLAWARAQKNKVTTAKQTKYAATGATVGIAGALLLGASLPAVLGAGAVLGIVGLLTAKGGS